MKSRYCVDWRTGWDAYYYYGRTKVDYVQGWCDHFEGALPGYDDWKTSLPRDEEDAHSDPPDTPAHECPHGVFWPEYCHDCWRHDRDAFER